MEISFIEMESELPPADIAKLIRYIESEGIPCDYTPYGSFDYLTLTIVRVDCINIGID
jgi:hypothetical protein